MCQHWHPFDTSGSPTLRFISFLEEVKTVAVCHSPGVWTPEETVYTSSMGSLQGACHFLTVAVVMKKKFLKGRLVPRCDLNYGSLSLCLH